MDQQQIAAAMGRAKEYLRSLPPGARYPDTRAVATVERGLRVRVTGDSNLQTDMVTGIGGDASAPTPGWYFRAAYAACVTSLITMRAAELGFTFDGLEVTVDSESDDRGVLGVVPDVRSGPLSMKVTVRYSGSERDEAESRRVVEWGVEHCPVHDAVVRSVPVEVVVTQTARAAVPAEQ